MAGLEEGPGILAITTGKLITLEGGEGAGKSTHALMLAAELGTSGIDVVTTREPGGSPGAEDIRGLLVAGDTGRWDPICEALLHSAARRDHVVNLIRPALGRGQWVISDRFADSTTAYQGYGHRLGVEVIAELQRLVIGNFTPDLTLILDVVPEIGLGRAKGRQATAAEDRYERMDAAFHDRVREGFLAIARAEPGRCVVIDAGQDEQAVHDSIVAAVKQRLGASAP